MLAIKYLRWGELNYPTKASWKYFTTNWVWNCFSVCFFFKLNSLEKKTFQFFFFLFNIGRDFSQTHNFPILEYTFNQYWHRNYVKSKLHLLQVNGKGVSVEHILLDGCYAYHNLKKKCSSVIKYAIIKEMLFAFRTFKFYLFLKNYSNRINKFLFRHIYSCPTQCCDKRFRHLIFINY